MRKPNQRLVSSFAPTDIKSQSEKGRTLSLTRQIAVALGLAGAMICLPMGVAHAQGPHDDTRPAVMSLKAAQTLLLDIGRAGDRLVAVGARGHIVHSDDQGDTWIQAPVPTRQMLTAVHFVDDQNGWAVGHDSLILHTSDAGESWEIQYRDPELDEEIDPEGPGLLEKPLMDVWFRDANTGFAFGAYGLALRTDDGGQTWDDITYDIDNQDGFHYNAITRVGEQGLFLVGEMGTMYRSRDLGDTWETIEDMPYDGSLFGVTGVGEENVVFIWGLRGNMFRSEDFGDSWEQVELDTPHNGPLEATLFGGTATDDGKMVVVGAGGAVVTSEDRGQTFEVAFRPDRSTLATGKVLESGQVLLVGQRGAIKADSNGLPAQL